MVDLMKKDVHKSPGILHSFVCHGRTPTLLFSLAVLRVLLLCRLESAPRHPYLADKVDDRAAANHVLCQHQRPLHPKQTCNHSLIAPKTINSAGPKASMPSSMQQCKVRQPSPRHPIHPATNNGLSRCRGLPGYTTQKCAVTSGNRASRTLSCLCCRTPVSHPGKAQVGLGCLRTKCLAWRPAAFRASRPVLTRHHTDSHQNLLVRLVLFLGSHPGFMSRQRSRHPAQFPVSAS